LREWLQRHGKQELAPWLAAVAAEMGVRYRKVQVRGQRTRWGSCSDSGTISLNYSLLFLPPRLVRYLFIHELCHLRYLDHSDRFWARVELFAPNWRRLERELREARRMVPDWVELA
jgi:predicted metal-dependent hydrolase